MHQLLELFGRWCGASSIATKAAWRSSSRKKLRWSRRAFSARAIVHILISRQSGKTVMTIAIQSFPAKGPAMYAARISWGARGQGRDIAATLQLYCRRQGKRQYREARDREAPGARTRSKAGIWDHIASLARDSDLADLADSGLPRLNMAPVSSSLLRANDSSPAPLRRKGRAQYPGHRDWELERG